MSSDFSDEISDVREDAQANTVLKSEIERQFEYSSSKISQSEYQSDTEQIVRRQLNLKTPKTHKTCTSLNDRSKQHLRTIQEKIQAQREINDIEEMKECSFRPKINRTLARRRNTNEFYRDMMAFQSSKVQFIENQKISQENNLETYSFHPEISLKSVKIVNHILNRSSGFNISNNANNQSNQLSNCQNLNSLCKKFTYEDRPHIPKISKTARNLKRKGPAYKNLYADALRRRQSYTDVQSPKAIPTNAKNKGFLISGFLRELESVKVVLDVDKIGYINYKRFKKFFKLMGFVRSKCYGEDLILMLDIWDKVEKINGKVNVKDLIVVMMGIMGYFKPWMNDYYSQKFTLRKTECEEFHRRYIRLFHNRLGVKRMKISKVYPELFSSGKMNNLNQDNDQLTYNSRKTHRSCLVFFDHDVINPSDSFFRKPLLTNIASNRKVPAYTSAMNMNFNGKSILLASLQEKYLNEIDNYSSSSSCNSQIKSEEVE